MSGTLDSVVGRVRRGTLGRGAPFGAVSNSKICVQSFFIEGDECLML